MRFVHHCRFATHLVCMVDSWMVASCLVAFLVDWLLVIPKSISDAFRLLREVRARFGRGCDAGQTQRLDGTRAAAPSRSDTHPESQHQHIVLNEHPPVDLRPASVWYGECSMR